MSQTICKMYGSNDNAMAAVAELSTYRWEGEITAISAAGADGAARSADDIVNALLQAYVLRAEALIYAEGIARGGILVVVHAGFSAGQLALNILDRYNPIDSGIPEPASTGMIWDEAAPLSSALQMPTYCADPTPFATAWNLPTLAGDCASLSKAIGLSELASSDSSLSGAIGMPLLSSNPAPLSSLLHLPLIR